MSVYNKYGDFFIKAFDCIGAYNPAATCVIPRHEYEYNIFSNPDFVKELISKLLNIKQYFHLYSLILFSFYNEQSKK